MLPLQLCQRRFLEQGEREGGGLFYAAVVSSEIFVLLCFVVSCVGGWVSLV